MSDFFQELPKGELHLHLEGSIEPETAQELAPELSREMVRTMYEFTDFTGFLESFKWAVNLLRTPDDYALTTRRLLERLERENVRYAEITIAAGVVLWKKQAFAPIYEAICRAAARSSVRVFWILDAIRHFGAEDAMRVAEMAVERVDGGVVAFGIGGDERRGPAEWFDKVFEFARSRGLRLTAHAGETAGPESIRAALAIGAERIGHGIAAVWDESLMRELRDRGVPLEVCISSNVRTGAVDGLNRHPAKTLYDAGVPITLNTDDPAIFGTNLVEEYKLAAGFLGFSESDIREIAGNAFRYAFRHPA